MKLDRETFSWRTIIHWLFHWDYALRAGECFECSWERLFGKNGKHPQ